MKKTLLLACLCLLPTIPAGHSQEPAPRTDSGIQERTGRRLIQLRLSVEADGERAEARAAALAKEDILVRVGLDEVPVEHYELDNLCRSASPALAAEAVEDDDTLHREREPRVSPSVAIFLDLPRIGLEGRINARTMLRRVIPELIADGNRVRLVSNRGRLHVAHEWTADTTSLLEALEAEFSSRRGTETAAAGLDERIETALRAGRVDDAVSLARERNLARQAAFGGGLEPFVHLIDQLADVPLPKSVLYFATLPYPDRATVVDRAILTGVNIYTVLASGQAAEPIVFTSLWNHPGSIMRSSLRSLSGRTGGRMAYGGPGKGAPRRLLESMRSDVRCVYILSLDARELELAPSVPLKVKLRPGVGGGVRLRTTPRLRVPSESTIRSQQVESAFLNVSPGMTAATLSVRPLSVVGSRVRALVQFAIDPPAGQFTGAPTTWDVGVSDALRSPGTGDRNIRVTSRAAPRVVFESEAELPLARFALVGVAQEIDGPGLARGVTIGAFREPAKRAIGFAGPLGVLQGRRGVFVVDEETAEGLSGSIPSGDAAPRSSGWLTAADGMLLTDRPTLLAAMLCRGRKHRGEVRIHKSLELESGREIAGPATEWSPNRDERCTVVESRIDAGRLHWQGRPYPAVYRLTAVDLGSGATETLERRLWVIGPAEGSARSPTGLSSASDRDR